MRATVLEVVDARAAAVGAERSVGPTDRSEMPDAGVLVRESAGQIVKGVEVLQHRHLQPTRGIYSLAADGSSSYINPLTSSPLKIGMSANRFGDRGEGSLRILGPD